MHRGIQVFNRTPADTARSWLLDCCVSHIWAERLVAHRPFPDTDALLAAADEASYDLLPAQRAAALAAERPHGPHPAGVPAAALTALGAAHAAYESRFGRVFVICLDDHRPDEHLDQTLAGLRGRLGNDPDEERVVAADELRRVARGRLARLVARIGAEEPDETPQGPGKAENSREFPDSGPTDSPYVPV
ncbi:2-oxo-4-hydroxy-4-carboxy-5-ureidoimidazoline decarboxylase [Streptomyces boluensis]|uniref:2-oxo-4-hydroxy-4-carboxy-5-ureidoimidazoline decarboxylase n=1 Tax=Streptomyces boluensis TaxID=1775135 RepID=UPI0028AA64B9|nr:2-oxo-4-hydroxy-4-carboxy-5-ureidoimidazoline decarboxylase [Streptomyces boluensis]